MWAKLEKKSIVFPKFLLLGESNAKKQPKLLLYCVLRNEGNAKGIVKMYEIILFFCIQTQ